MNKQSPGPDEDSQFFSKARHSLRQQLYAMTLLGQLALRQEPSGNDTLKKLIAALEGFEPYLMGILQFAKTESCRTPARRIPTELQHIFQRLNLHFDGEASASQAELQIRSTQARLDTDPDLLFEMMRHLIQNALSFARSRVLVAARQHRHQLTLEVWDDGPGISAEAMEKMFDPFYSTSPAAGVMPGPGLGLPTVKLLAQRLAYPLQVDSAVGQGTRVRVTIPSANLSEGKSFT